MRRALLAASLVVTLLACGSPEMTPERTVDLYFTRLGADPIGSLTLLSPAFHARHGLRVRLERDPGTGATQGAEEPGAAAELSGAEMARAEMAWVAVQKLAPLKHHLPGLQRRQRAAETQDDAARVVVELTPAGGLPPFVQAFELSRKGRDAPWQIDEILQQEVVPSNAAAAFAAAPSAERWRAIGRPKAP